MGYLGHPKAENIGHVFLNMPYIYNDVGRNTPPRAFALIQGVCARHG